MYDFLSAAQLERLCKVDESKDVQVLHYLMTGSTVSLKHLVPLVDCTDSEVGLHLE